MLMLIIFNRRLYSSVLVCLEEYNLHICSVNQFKTVLTNKTKVTIHKNSNYNLK